MLILLADQTGISVGDLFHAAVIPGLILTSAYCTYIFFKAERPQDNHPALEKGDVKQLFLAIVPPLGLMLLVLGSIFFGVATPTEASGLLEP